MMKTTATGAGGFAARFTTNPPVKVCCIQSAAEAQMAISAGASALGLVSEMPSGPGVISEELGGTGRTHDWSLSRRIARQAAVPVFLAGGLKPENVRQAFDAVRPFGLDVCSGVRDDGRLDAEKLARFIARTRDDS